VLSRRGATGGVQWRGPGFTAATSVDLAAGPWLSWTVALPSPCLRPAMGRCCLKGDGRLGPSWGAVAPLGATSGAAAGSRRPPDSIWPESILGCFGQEQEAYCSRRARVDFGASRIWSMLAGSSGPRFWPGAVGLLLPASKLCRAADAPDRLLSRRNRVRFTHLDACSTSMVILAISAEVDCTWPKSGGLAGSCRPTAPSDSTRFRRSR